MSSAHSLPTSRTFITHLINSLPTLGQLPSADPPSNSTTTTTPNNPLHAVPEAAKKQLLTLHVLFPNELLPALDLLDRRLVTRFRIRAHPENGKNTTTAPSVDTVADPTTAVRGAEGAGDVAAQMSGTASAPYMLDDARALATGQADDDVEMQDAGEGGRVDTSPVEGTDAPQVSSEMADPAQSAQHVDTRDTVYYVRSAQQKSSRYSTSYDTSTSYEVRLEAWNCSCPAFAFAAFPPVLDERGLSALDDEAGLEAVAGQDHEWRFGGCTLGENTPPVCKHLLACVLVERVGMFSGFVEEKEVSVEEAAGWAAGWGD